MRWLLLCLLSVPSFAQQQGDPKGPFDARGNYLFTVPNPKDCGLVTRLSPNLLQPGCLQSVQNAYFDDDFSFKRRGGYSAYNPTACAGGSTIKGEWPFYGRDGVQYLIVFSSNSMYYSAADGNCNLINPSNGGSFWNLTASAEMQCAQGMGKLVCTDLLDPVFETDIVTSNTISGAPQGSLIGFFRNRFWIGGVSGNLTQLYSSGQYNETDWTLNLYPNLSTSPVQIDISGANDGQKMTCFLGQFQNQFLIGRNYDLFGLAGYDNRDFTMRKVSEQIGCIQPKSAQEVNNNLYWVSKRGVEDYTGTQIVPASYPIDPTIRQVIAATGNSQSKLITTQGDWNAGNLTASGPGAPVSSSISPGDVVPSSWSVVESTPAFVQGTFVNVSTVPYAWYQVGGATIPTANAISLIQGATASFTNAGAESNSLYVNWSSMSYVKILSDTSMYGTHSFAQDDTGAILCAQNGVLFSLTDALTGNIISSATIFLSANDPNTIHKFTWDTSASTASMVVFHAKVPSGSFGMEAVSVPFIRGTAMTVKSRAWDSVNQTPCVAFDIDETNIVTTGTYTTQTYNTGFSTPTWGDLNVVSLSSQAPNASLVFQTKVATSASGVFDAQVTNTNNWKIASGQKQYIVSVASFSVASTTNTPPAFATLGLAAETTAYYITQCVQVSTPSSWGTLQVDASNNGGSFTFWTSTGATCGAAIASTATWNAQSPNAQISVTTNTTYIGERILFTVDTGTQVPTLNDITFNWNTGGNAPPVASAEYLDRYYLFYTTSTAAGAHNDHALVYDYNQKWTLLDDVNAYSATKYLNQLFLGDSNATGKIYQAETGQSDNGGAFTTSFRTGDLDFGEPAQRKILQWAYVLLDGPASGSQSIQLACNYQLDGSSTSYSLGQSDLREAPEQSGYYVAKMSVPVGSPATGHWINVGCSYSGTDGPLRVYGLKLVYQKVAWE